MLVDADHLESGQVIDADVCIIGAGAAGITIAREFAKTRTGVCLLEGGSLEGDAASQSLYETIRNVGRDYPSLHGSRTRFFGGSTNCWTGHCMPLRAVNFEKLSWSRYTGWPISLADLQPYYRRAEVILGLSTTRCDAASIAARLGLKLLPFDPTRILTEFSPYDPVRFGQVFRKELADASNIQVVPGANVTSIEAHKDGQRIERVAVRTLRGRNLGVRARVFVLGTGGIENARTLLASDSVHAKGLGNEHDLVGRFFMTHIWYSSGLILPASQQVSFDLYTKDISAGKSAGEIACHANLVLPEQVVRQGGIPDFRAALNTSHTLRYKEAVHSAQVLKESIGKFDWPDDIGRHLANIIGHPGDVLSAARHRGGALVLLLKNVSEQAPNPTSRINLAHEKDALGMPVATIDWRLSDIDKHGIRYAHSCIAKEVGRSGFGRMFIELPDDEPELLAGADGGAHHMGTTRMHDSPRLGVVDKNCRVHGIGNLFVAGSSVFPTGGCANPTLTIIALATRLSDHIKAGLHAGV